jgi:hypothetical protein
MWKYSRYPEAAWTDDMLRTWAEINLPMRPIVYFAVLSVTPDVDTVEIKWHDREKPVRRFKECAPSAPPALQVVEKSGGE